MVKRKPLQSRWQALLDIALSPAVAHLPATVPFERRNTERRHALLCRVHSEFQEMPGLSVTPGQAARLFGLTHDVAARILDRLAEARVLCQKRDGQFTLSEER
jgi:hypothetical protein